jgi:hypothetical protein
MAENDKSYGPKGIVAGQRFLRSSDGAAHAGLRRVRKLKIHLETMKAMPAGPMPMRGLPSTTPRPNTTKTVIDRKVVNCN